MIQNTSSMLNIVVVSRDVAAEQRNGLAAHLLHQCSD